jgi:hypothetical protein
MESKIGLFSCLALANASSPHGYQSTGLCACWSRYGLLESISLFAAAGAEREKVKIPPNKKIGALETIKQFLVLVAKFVCLSDN